MELDQVSYVENILPIVITKARQSSESIRSESAEIFSFSSFMGCKSNKT